MSKQEVDNALKDIADVFEYQRAEIARLTDRLSQHDILIKSIKDERDTLLLQVESLNAQLKASWENKPRNILSNGLTLLQVNPDCAAQLDSTARGFGWLYIKGADNQWVTHRKLFPDEIEEAQDQASDCVIWQGTQVRFG